jgi:hypothetical protein
MSAKNHVEAGTLCVSMNRFILAIAVLCLSLFGPLTGGAWAQSDVSINLEQFGIGSTFRLGDVTAVRIAVTSNLDEPTAVWVQWEVPNADGDIVAYRREVTLSPGQTSPVWLYAPIPPESNASMLWPVRVLQNNDGRPGRDLGGTRISPSLTGAVPVQLESSVFGLICDTARTMGLNGYTATYSALSGRPADMPIAAHENTHLILGLSPADICDRWYGLRTMEVLVWGDGNTNSPKELTLDQANAIRQWVQRGGHLVIALPQAGNPWDLGIPREQYPHDLHDLLPPGAPRRDVDVELQTLLPVLGKHRLLAANSNVDIRVFKDLNTGFNCLDDDGIYQPLITMEDGRVVVVTRTYGHGRITLLGIDVSSGMINVAATSNGLPVLQADRFWNRILGRRCDTPSRAALMNVTPARLPANTPALMTIADGRIISQRINMSGPAAAGLTLAFFLFVIYWVVAGPGGFGLLRMYRLAKHSWVTYAISAAVFSVVAWFSVLALRNNDVRVKHVSIIDSIARPGGDRGDSDPQLHLISSYFSLYLPGYSGGDRGPLLASSELDNQRDLLHSWYPPRTNPQPFPNIDNFAVDVGRDAASFRVPSRATATLMYGNHLGAAPDNWGDGFHVDPEDPIEVVYQGNREYGLRGSILHNLPRPLTDVTAIWVMNRRITPRRYETGANAEPIVSTLASGQMLNNGRMWSVSGPIPAGTRINLADAQQLASANVILSKNIKQDYIDPYKSNAFTGPQSRTPSEKQALEMLSIFGQLDPPQYFKQRTNDPPINTVRMHRVLGRELDLSDWFTQPCLIIMGFMEGPVDMPLPLTVNGRAPNPEDGSLVMVRWIYPLPLREDIAFGLDTDQTE